MGSECCWGKTLDLILEKSGSGPSCVFSVILI
jgi:hypothetical protein